MNSNPAKLRTRIYVDGYNFYYGCLKGSSYKWLDLEVVFSTILSTILFEVNGTAARFDLLPLGIKYFTAPILQKFAKTNESVARQTSYHAALKAHMGQSISIIEGRYDSREARAYEAIKGQKPRDSDLKDIWKLEEKESDVSLALHAFGDAIQDEVDHVVFVTNDTDLVPAMKMIRQKTRASIGLIVPSRENVRKPNASLVELADWTRRNLKDEELERSQMPTPIRGNNRTIHKPVTWYPRPDLLVPVFNEVKRVRRSNGSAWKWLNEQNERFEGRTPISMTACDADVEILWCYLKTYARDFNV